MPVDISQLRPQIIRVSQHMMDARDSRERCIAVMRAAFQRDFDYQTWNRYCRSALNLQGVHWTGALFSDEEPVNQFIPFHPEPESYVLIASDGSQIMPDRHKSVQYAAIQVASICIVYGSAAKTQKMIETEKLSHRKPLTLMSEVEIYDDATGDNIAPGEISTERDLQEIEELADQCERYRSAGMLPIAVADGSLVPFLLLNEPFVRNSSRRASRLLQRITTALTRMRDCGAVVGGYIDRPNSNSVTRSCSLADLSAGIPLEPDLLRSRIRKADQQQRGIMDRQLLDTVIPYGHRTALFEPQWLVNGPGYLGESGHTMRCCYMNIDATRPNIVRLEMPAWCADPSQVGMLAQIMARHAGMGGGYPLCLKAAHEEALLSHTDEQRIDLIMERALMDRGMVTMPSSKQEAKDRR